MRHVLQAPHRMMFFIGAGNVLLAMAWWAAWLVSARWPGVFRMAQPTQYAGWLHAIVMQYQVLASFVFGFLLTVFPRWMGLPDLPRAASSRCTASIRSPAATIPSRRRCAASPFPNSKRRAALALRQRHGPPEKYRAPPRARGCR